MSEIGEDVELVDFSLSNIILYEFCVAFYS